ncbi:MAG TPA: hypothetical protein VG267_15220 [Terracidiphilus sp.]|jgi:hypothetical protein|nr:hypothetical protein [Terracidiphilus sp.]
MPRKSSSKSKKEQPQSQPPRTERPKNDSAVSAVHHVGKTLESDPEYNQRPSLERAPQAGLIDRSGNDLTASPDMRDSDPLLGGGMSVIGPGARPEPLKTRLPGDTSSDPHTDLGPDNATTVQHRGE